MSYGKAQQTSESETMENKKAPQTVRLSMFCLNYQANKRSGRDSNPRPHAWQACILTSWTTKPFQSLVDFENDSSFDQSILLFNKRHYLLFMLKNFRSFQTSGKSNWIFISTKKIIQLYHRITISLFHALTLRAFNTFEGTKSCEKTLL